MYKKKSELRRKQSTRQLMDITRLTDHGVQTADGELVFYLIDPDNLSVLPEEEVRQRCAALGNLLRFSEEIILVALDSRESFQHNRDHYLQRSEQEELPGVRELLRQDMAYLDAIQRGTASSREFAILFRLDEQTAADPAQLAQLEKRIHGYGFRVALAQREDVKRILAVYYQQDAVTDSFDDHDGERAVISNAQK